MGKLRRAVQVRPYRRRDGTQVSGYVQQRLVGDDPPAAVEDDQAHTAAAAAADPLAGRLLDAPVGRIEPVDADWAQPSHGGSQPVFDAALVRPTNPAGLRLHRAETLDDVDRLAAHLDRSELVAVDVETGQRDDDVDGAALWPERGDGWLVGMSLATSPTSAIYVPLQHDDSPANLPLGEVLERLGPRLEQLPIVCHSAAMERRWFDRYGVRLNVVGDTRMLMLRVAPDESTALKEVTRREFGHQQTRIETLFGDGESIRFNQLDPRDQAVVDYAGEDAAWTMALHRRYPDLTSGGDEAYRRLVGDCAATERLVTQGVKAHWAPRAVAEGVVAGEGDEAIAVRVRRQVAAQHAALREQQRRTVRRDRRGFFDELTSSPYGPSPKQTSYLIRLLGDHPDPRAARRLAFELRDMVRRGDVERARERASTMIGELKTELGVGEERPG